jgi:hypothetical protein
MNSSALSDMNEKEGMYLHKWKVQMRSCFTKKNLQRTKRSATRSKDYKT